ncbi:Glycogen operon protein GlgX [Streptomyces tendae]
MTCSVHPRHGARLRKDHPGVLRRRRFFHGRPVQGTHDELSDIAWFTPEGAEITQRDWNSARASALTVFLNGNAISEPGPRGERIADDSFLLMFNASPKPLDFAVPVDQAAVEVVVDTALATGVPADTGPKVQAGERLTLVDRSLTVLAAAGVGGATMYLCRGTVTGKAAGRVRRFP